MRYPEDVIARVKEASDVVEVVSQYLPLTRAGANFKALCPFHAEKTPSFMVNPSRQIFHCFGCSTGGDVIRFIMLKEGLPFAEALRKLADRAGIELPSHPEGAGASQSHRDLLFRANRLAAERYAAILLKGAEGKRARDYLSRREIHQEVSRAFGVGYAPAGWRGLLTALAEEGIDAATAVAAGLAVPGEGGREPYDRFRDRIVFPIRDLSGRVLGFGGRVLGDELPKYINTPETEVYRKGDFLFGMDQATSAVREADEVLLTEGYLDVISLHQNGVRNVVGVLGTALTGEQARRLRRLSRNCVLVFDGDEAGRKAALRSGLILLEEGFRCRVAALEPGEDPDSFVRKRGADALRGVVKGSPHLIRYVMDDTRSRHPGDRLETRLNILDAITPYLAKIKDRAELGLYLGEAADELRIEQHDLRARLASVAGRRGAEAEGGTPGVRLNRREGLLVHLMVRDPSTVQAISRVLRPEDYGSPGATPLVRRLYEGVPLSAILDGVDDPVRDTLTRWAMEDPVGGVAEALTSALRQVRLESLGREVQDARARWAEAVEGGRQAEAEALARRWKELARQLDGLRSRKDTHAQTQEEDAP